MTVNDIIPKMTAWKRKRHHFIKTTVNLKRHKNENDRKKTVKNSIELNNDSDCKWHYTKNDSMQKNDITLYSGIKNDIKIRNDSQW